MTTITATDWRQTTRRTTPNGHPARSRVVDFATAHAHLLAEGRVPEAAGQHRITCCTGITQDGERVSEPCPSYQNERNGRGSGHCADCRCPSWPISEMHREGKTVEPGKAWFPSLACPQNRFTEAPGRRALPQTNPNGIGELTDGKANME